MDVRASFPNKELNLNSRGNVPDLVLLVQEQFLRDAEQRLECLDVGVPVGDQVVNIILY